MKYLKPLLNHRYPKSLLIQVWRKLIISGRRRRGFIGGSHAPTGTQSNLNLSRVAISTCRGHGRSALFEGGGEGGEE